MVSAHQSLRHGSTVFNVLYAESLVCLQNKLLEEGFVARVVCPSQSFDPESCDSGSAVPTIDKIYVDDLTVIIVAASPAALWRALDTSDG